MRNHRGFPRLTVLLVATVLAVSVTAVAWWYPQLPDPEAANRTELLHWLVTRDLSQETLQTQRTLARRLEEEFAGEIDWESLDGQMDRNHRRQLWANLPVLLEPWFMDHVVGFHGQAPEERLAYVDQTINAIALWEGISSLEVEERTLEQKHGGLLPMLLGHIETWKQQAEPQQRERMNQFLSAVQARWLIRKLSGDLPRSDR